MKVRLPAYAPLGPPEIGASMKSPRPESATAFETSREVAVSMVDVSMKKILRPVGLSERSPVSGSLNTNSTCLPAGKEVRMMSCSIGQFDCPDIARRSKHTACSATARGESATVTSPSACDINFVRCFSLSSQINNLEPFGIF